MTPAGARAGAGSTNPAERAGAWVVALMMLAVVVVLAAGCGEATVGSAEGTSGQLRVAESASEPSIAVLEPDQATPVPDPAAPADGAGGDDGTADGAGGDDGTADGAGGDDGTAGDDEPAEGTVEMLVPEVIATYPHDNTAYTQGLEVIDGLLVEGTGRVGHPGKPQIYGSDLRRVEIETGEVLDIVDLPGEVFGEGVTRVDDTIIQLSWKDGRAFYWDAETFEPIGEVGYEGQGWGLCYDGTRLAMTDGSARITFRDPASFDAIGQLAVTLDGEPLSRINELECVAGAIWANIWQDDRVVRIDPDTGRVTAVVDASALGQPRTPPTEVLNGIAWDAETRTWLMTGKFWSHLYRVRFVPAG